MAPVLVKQVIRHFLNGAIVSQVPPTSSTSKNSVVMLAPSTPRVSIPTTVTSFEVIPTSTIDLPSTGDTPQIPNWTYIIITTIALTIALLLLIGVSKGLAMVGRKKWISWNIKKESLIWSEMEEGRRIKLKEAFKKLEGNKENGNEMMKDIDDAWEEILREVEVELQNFRGSQSLDWDKYASGVLQEKFKALGSSTSIHGEVSSPELDVPFD